MAYKGKDIDLIERYLAGELSGKELEAFEIKKAGDPELQKSVDEMSVMIDCVKDSAQNSLLNDLKELEGSLPEVVLEEKELGTNNIITIGSTKVRKLFWRATQYAALAASLVGIFFGIARPHYQFVQNPEQYRNEPISLLAMNITADRGEDTSSADFEDLVNLYEQDKFGKIISILKDDDKSDIQWMLLGNSYFQKKKYKQASECFMLKNFEQYSELLDEASFSLALCYNALGQKEKAKKLLTDLANTKGEFSLVSKQLLQNKRFSN